MKLPIAFIFHPAQEFTVRVAGSAQEAIQPALPAGWAGYIERQGDPAGAPNKKRWRVKSRRAFLELEPA